MAPWHMIAALAAAVLAAAFMLFKQQLTPPDDLLSYQSVSLEPEQEARKWNLLEHLGGYGPYVPKVHGIVHNDTALPSGCRIDQVHMLARHSERYPTVTAGTHMLSLYHRLDFANVTLNGSLAFTRDWEFLTDNPTRDFEQLTSTGPFAGTLTAFKLGTETRTRYEGLLKSATAGGRSLKIWASDSQRVIETARYFLDGLLGLSWQQKASLEIISEAADQGADTLTPGDTCLKYANNDDAYGWDYGTEKSLLFGRTYLKATQARLLEENPNFPFSVDELYVMHEICAFEIMAYGKSKWCDVFTHEEWESFEYTRDLLHYYRSGPGNPYAATMGWLWLNATSNLLQQGPEAGPMFLSFVHDGDIIPMLSALDLFPQHPALPTSHIDHNRTWRMSDTVPMAARITFERMTYLEPQECWSNAPLYPNHVYCTPQTISHSVRIQVNGAIVPLPKCESGPGKSCPLEEFTRIVQRRGDEVGTFADVCGLSPGTADRIMFLHQ